MYGQSYAGAPIQLARARPAHDRAVSGFVAPHPSRTAAAGGRGTAGLRPPPPSRTAAAGGLGMSMLRILHLGKYYTPDRGGIETVVETLCRGERPIADTQALGLNKGTA